MTLLNTITLQYLIATHTNFHKIPCKFFSSFINFLQYILVLDILVLLNFIFLLDCTSEVKINLRAPWEHFKLINENSNGRNYIVILIFSLFLSVFLSPSRSIFHFLSLVLCLSCSLYLFISLFLSLSFSHSLYRFISVSLPLFFFLELCSRKVIFCDFHLTEIIFNEALNSVFSCK